MWEVIEDFPEYEVSSAGEVRNIKTGRILTTNLNQYGNAYVALRQHHVQRTKSVPLLVARAFLDPPEYESFDTPINLNGDRLDNRVENLVWRPRWFAIRYQRQFRASVRLWAETPIKDVNTGKIYRSGWAACLEHGLLYRDVMYSAMHQTEVWPTKHVFTFID